MSKKITKEQYDRLKRVQEQANEQFSGQFDNIDPNDSCEVLDCLGECYPIGNVTLPPLTPSIMPLLEMIDSPFISAAQGEEASFLEVVKTLYVIGARETAVEPLMGLKQKEAAIRKCEEVAKASPAHFQVYVDKLDSLNDKWSEFDKNALAFYDEIGSPNLSEIGEVVISMMRSAFGGFALLPEDGKKNEADTTQNG